MNNFYNYDESIRFSDEEIDEMSNLNMFLDQLETAYITDNPYTVDNNILNLTNKEKKVIINKILEKSYNYEYISNCMYGDESFINMFEFEEGWAGIADLFYIQSSREIYDFWKMIRDGIDRYKIHSFISEDKVEEIFENMYITSCKTVNEFINTIDNFYKQHYSNMALECNTYLESIEYLDEYLPQKLVNKYIVSSIILTTIDNLQYKEDTHKKFQYNEDDDLNDWPF